MFSSQRILGLSVNCVTMDEAIRCCLAMIGERSSAPDHFDASTPPLLVKAPGRPRVYDALQSSELVLADGMPVLWIARALGARSADRVTGVDLMAELLRVAGHQGLRLFFLGARTEVLDAGWSRKSVTSTRGPSSSVLARRLLRARGESGDRGPNPGESGRHPVRRHAVAVQGGLVPRQPRASGHARRLTGWRRVRRSLGIHQASAPGNAGLRDGMALASAHGPEAKVAALPRDESRLSRLGSPGIAPEGGPSVPVPIARARSLRARFAGLSLTDGITHAHLT